MKNKSEWQIVDFGAYEIVPTVEGFELDVRSFDSFYGPDTITLNALEVYRDLKEYFEETEYE